MKNCILIFLIVANVNLLVAGLNSTHWRIITIDIARDGDPKDSAEFEAARQAFLHIKDEPEAKLAAQTIQNKWKATFGTEATAGSKSYQGSLLSLTRYPLMDKEQAKQAAIKLLETRDIAQLLDEQQLKVVMP